MYENMKKYFKSNITLEYEFRKNALITLRDEIIKYRDDINKALYKDLGKSEFEAEFSEVSFSIMEINYLIKNLKKLMKDKKVYTSIINFKSKSYIKRDPHGLVLIISPWNYPFNLSVVPLAASIAAGNVTVLKTSSSSKNTSILLEKIITSIFPKEYVKLEKGGVGVNEKVMSEKYDFIFFTGGKVTGREIYKKAANDLTEVVLELGGKSPCIVDESANLKVSAKRIIWGKLLNCGQTCIAVDYLLVKRSIYKEFKEELLKSIEELYGNDPILSSDYGSIVNEKEYNRLLNILNKENLTPKKDNEKLKIAPVIFEANWDSFSMKDEIFGPILPIIIYDDIDTELEEINKRDTPLALYIFSKNKNFINSITKKVKFGGGCVNDTITHISNSNLPFGGSGDSGFGKYHGKYSFYTFSREKGILDKKYFPDISIRYPPRKNKVNLIKKVMK